MIFSMCTFKCECDREQRISVHPPLHRGVLPDSVGPWLQAIKETSRAVIPAHEVSFIALFRPTKSPLSLFTYIAWTRPRADWARTVSTDDRRLQHPARVCAAAHAHRAPRPASPHMHADSATFRGAKLTLVCKNHI